MTDTSAFAPPAAFADLPARFAHFDAARAATPILHDPDSDRWHLFTYADCDRVMLDYATFSSEPPRPTEPSADSFDFDLSILGLDPPRHRQLRGLVSQAFTPKAIAALRPQIETIRDELLAPLRGAGAMDLIHDFAAPLPVTVIANMLGVPASDRQDFKHWSDETVVRDPARSEAATAAIAAYFTDFIAERRRAPGDDLIDALLRAEVDGERLTDHEIIAFAMLLLIAGNETTTNLIGNAIFCLDAHPDWLRRARAEPALVPGVIEESLRWLPPVWGGERFVRRPATVAGADIPAAASVVTWLAAANRDPDRFPDPTRFDPTRDPNRHLSFGRGIHACLGAPLARLEAAVALTALLALPGLRVRPGAPIVAIDSDVVFGPGALPVVWDAVA